MLVNTTCSYCRHTFTTDVPEDGYRRWKEGELIQSALRELNKDKRELLLTGICKKCWDETFGSCKDDE